jgi:hypothetical protein
LTKRYTYEKNGRNGEEYGIIIVAESPFFDIKAGSNNTAKNMVSILWENEKGRQGIGKS